MFIAVHVGAGFHSPQKEAGYRDAMCQAVTAAAAALRAGQSSLEAVVAAIIVLEDCPLTNAGTGSNLNLAGHVECDASVMDGDGTFGAVAAAPGVSNPIAAAAALAADAKVPLPLGLVRPIMLAGDAVRRFALAKGLQCAPDAAVAQQWLVTPAALSAWQRYSHMLQEAGYEVSNGTLVRKQLQQQQGQHACDAHGKGQQAATAAAAEQPLKRRRLTSNGLKPAALNKLSNQQQQQHHHTQQQQSQQSYLQQDSEQYCQHHQRQTQHSQQQQQQQHQQHQEQGAGRLADVGDTVGCIVVDTQGSVAAGVSSGGLAMKADGRVGEAAVYGSGCWACEGTGQLDFKAASAPGVALSASGVGEHIMRAGLARACGEALQAQGAAEPAAACVDEQCSEELRRRILSGPAPWDCGLLAARVTLEAAGGTAAANGNAGPRMAVDALASALARQLDDVEGSGAGDVSPTGQHGAAQQEADISAPGGTCGGGSGSSGAGATVHVEFAAVHSAASFGIAYLGPGMRSARVDFMRTGPAGGSLLPAARSFGGSAGAGHGGGRGAAATGNRMGAKQAGRVPPPVAVLGFSCSWGCRGAS